MNFRRLAATPSFYIWTTWLVVAVALAFPPVATESLSLKTSLIITLVIVSGVLSNLFFEKQFYFAATHFKIVPDYGATLMIFFITTILGVWGLSIYLRYAVDIVGGLGNYIYLVFNSPLSLRAVSIDDLGGAVQLTYLSWVSFTMAVFIAARKDYWAIFRLGAFAVGISEFIINMAFVDRTRPVWLVVVGALALVFSTRKPMKSLKTLVYVLPITIAAMFLVFATVTQKISGGGVTETFAQYVLGGILYLNRLFDLTASFDYLPVNSGYPVAKVLEAFNLIDDVPSQILSFFYVPFPTNVGTFVQPLYADGGLIYTVLGIPILIVITDVIALWALRSGTPLGVFIYANLLFCDLMAFFVPKFATTPIYFFILMFAALKFVDAVRRKPVRRVPLSRQPLKQAAQPRPRHLN